MKQSKNACPKFIGVLTGLTALVIALTVFGQISNVADSKIRCSASSLDVLLQGLVLKDLVLNQSKGDDKVSDGVFCLDVNESNTSYFNCLFSNNVPRVECGTNSLVIVDDGLLDKLTKKAGKLFTARILAISNGVASVEGGWYGGPNAAEYMLYRLRRTESNWVIIDRKAIAVY